MSNENNTETANAFRVMHADFGRTWHATWAEAKKAAGKRGIIDVLVKGGNPSISTNWVCVTE
jgi:hypothetical protein